MNKGSPAKHTPLLHYVIMKNNTNNQSNKATEAKQLSAFSGSWHTHTHTVFWIGSRLKSVIDCHCHTFFNTLQSSVCQATRGTRGRWSWRSRLRRRGKDSCVDMWVNLSHCCPYLIFNIQLCGEDQWDFSMGGAGYPAWLFHQNILTFFNKREYFKIQDMLLNFGIGVLPD